jgi:translation initiation factor IF-2
MRIYDLAKQLNMDSRELLKKLKKLNFPAKSHMSSVDKETAEIIKHEIEELKEKEISSNRIEVDFPITVRELAVKLNKKSSQILSDLFKEGKMYTINQNLDEKTAKDIAYRYKINLCQKPSLEEKVLKEPEVKMTQRRAPVVTLMGHIDHGKTSILDYIRKSKIIDKEAGGITQHISAYRINLDNGDITFVDTPGHETFTAMRARGADVTDIIIIVIAAEEGIKPQTIEAIDHAKASQAPIIVAINKIDKANADVDLVKQQLSKADLVPEDWGGKVITVPVSAKTGKGINELLEMILLQSQMMELKTAYDCPAVGVALESQITKGRGAVTTTLMQRGILKVGDIAVCGMCWGRVRAMYDDRGNKVQQAYPAHPVEVIGINGVSSPGDKFFVVPDEKKARSIVDKREQANKKEKAPPTHMRLEDFHKKLEAQQIKQLKIILKADVGGTLEAIEESLAEIPKTSEVDIQFIHKGVGSVNYSDILLAEVSDAVVVGFKVGIEAKAKETAKDKGVQVRVYQIIYELINEIKAALEGLLTPKTKRTFLGRAKVKQVFKLSKAGIIAGCVVEKGKIRPNVSCELIREGEVITKSSIKTLKRFKNDAKEAVEGMECGIDINYKNIKEGDFIDAFLEEKIKRTL